MIVFVVTRCYTEPERIICAIFSSREKADAYVAAQDTEDRWPSWDVAEWEVDAPTTEKRGTP